MQEECLYPCFCDSRQRGFPLATTPGIAWRSQHSGQGQCSGPLWMDSTDSLKLQPSPVSSLSGGPRRAHRYLVALTLATGPAQGSGYHTWVCLREGQQDIQNMLQTLPCVHTFTNSRSPVFILLEPVFYFHLSQAVR